MQLCLRATIANLREVRLRGMSQEKEAHPKCNLLSHRQNLQPL
jgi:hypothetical protein